MVIKRLCAILLLLAAAAMFAGPGRSFADSISKLNEGAEVLRDIQTIPEQGIPPQLFRNAAGIAVIPGLIKAGFILGGRYGTGVIAVNRHGNWSGPAFISLAGPSFGLQIGAEVTDIILVFKTRRSLEAFRNGKFTLGADVSVAAGPVGRHAEAGTDFQMSAEIYSYSRSRGLFGGIAIEGAALAVDNEATSAFYGRNVSADEIFAGQVEQPPAAAKFSNMLQNYSGMKPKE